MYGASFGVSNYGSATFGSAFGNPDNIPNIPSCLIIIKDLDGIYHYIVDDVMTLNIVSNLTSSADTFNFQLFNYDDKYSYITQSSEVEIWAGMSNTITKQIVGIISSVVRSLDGEQIEPHMTISGEDWSYRLNKTWFSGRYLDQELSDIMKAILDDVDYTTGQTYREIAGISSDDSNIDTTLYSLDIASYPWKQLSEAFSNLVKLGEYDWYVDENKKIYMFAPKDETIFDTITDDDLVGGIELTQQEPIINRSIVIGGIEQVVDRKGWWHTTYTTVTDDVSKNQVFNPYVEVLSSVIVWTKKVSGSTSNLQVAIQLDDGTGNPDGVNLSGSEITIQTNDIIDDGYTTFMFKNNVVMIPKNNHYVILNGTTSDGVQIGINASGYVDTRTRFPVKVAIMANDINSQNKYGICSAVFRDTKLEVSEDAELIAQEKLSGEPVETASFIVYGNEIKSGAILRLYIKKLGVGIDKSMKVVTASHDYGDRFIYNTLNLREI